MDKIVDEIFKEIHETYESYDGGLIHLDNTSEDQIKESIKKAINYTRCSTQLKGENTPTFEEWKKTNLTDTNCYGGSYKHKLGWRTKEQLLEMYQREYFF